MTVWVSRKDTRISNFDVQPPNGIELPGVGLGGLSTGVGLGKTAADGHSGHTEGIYGGNPMMNSASGLQVRHK